MTMPTLMAQHRKQVVETRLAKFYSVINQAIKLSEAENGDSDYWVQPTAGWNGTQTEKYIEKYYKPYLNLAKYCGTRAGCFSDWYDAHTGMIKFVLADGVAVATTYTSNNVLYLAVDINGKQGPNKGGIDLFNFEIKHGGAIPYIYSSSADMTFDSGTSCQTKRCFLDACKLAPQDCAGLLRFEGWKIPKDYPIKL